MKSKKVNYKTCLVHKVVKSTMHIMYQSTPLIKYTIYHTPPLPHSHMGDFTQPQKKYAGTGKNCNIVIPVIIYPVMKTLRKFLCLSFGCASPQIFNSRAKKNNFANMLKIVQKSVNLRNSWTIFNIIAKKIFALEFNI